MCPSGTQSDWSWKASHLLMRISGPGRETWPERHTSVSSYQLLSSQEDKTACWSWTHHCLWTPWRCWELCLSPLLHFQKLHIPHSPGAASSGQTGAWLEREGGRTRGGEHRGRTWGETERNRKVSKVWNEKGRERKRRGIKMKKRWDNKEKEKKKNNAQKNHDI